MNRYQKVGKGVRLVFIGQICGVLSLYEIMVAISLLFFMAGLYLAARTEKKLWIAFWLEAGTLLLAVLETWFFYFPSLELIGVALHILGVFCICTVTSALLDEIGAGDTARWGRAVWKIYAGGRIGLYVFSDALGLYGILVVDWLLLNVFVNLIFRFAVGFILLLHLYNVSWKLEAAKTDENSDSFREEKKL